MTGPVPRRLVEIIANRLDGITRSELMDIPYADSPDGGPEWASGFQCSFAVQKSSTSPKAEKRFRHDRQSALTSGFSMNRQIIAYITAGYA